MSSLQFKGVRVRLEGIAGVRIYHGSKVVCIDILDSLNCDHLLYTHHHPRHYPGDEIVDTLSEKVIIISPMKGLRVKPGDTLKLDNMVINVVHAYERGAGETITHPRGLGVGFIVRFDDRVTLYHMGDTSLVDEILALRENVSVLFIPIGGDGVMSVEEAVEAVKSLRPVITIPMHYTDRRSFFKFRDMVQPYTQIIDLRR